MALQSKQYTRSSETLFSILDGVKTALSDVNEPNLNQKFILDLSGGHLCFRLNNSALNSITLDSDLSAPACIVTVVGDGSWYTAITGALDTTFGV